MTIIIFCREQTFRSSAARPYKLFFEENNGKEFIHFGTQQYQRDIQQRFNVYHFFTRQLGRKRDKRFWVYAETYARSQCSAAFILTGQKA